MDPLDPYNQRTYRLCLDPVLGGRKDTKPRGKSKKKRMQHRRPSSAAVRVYRCELPQAPIIKAHEPKREKRNINRRRHRRKQRRRPDIDRVMPVDQFRCQAFQPVTLEQGRIIHQQAQRRRPLARTAYQAGDSLSIREIASQGLGRASGGMDITHQPIRIGTRCIEMHNHVPAIRSQPPAQHSTNAAGTTGDEGGPIFSSRFDHLGTGSLMYSKLIFRPYPCAPDTKSHDCVRAYFLHISH